MFHLIQPRDCFNSFKINTFQMAEYFSQNSNVLSPSVNEELARKEHLQQRHYALFSELQNMARELAQKYQQRLPYELLSSLANSCLDGTVFEIVRGLKDIQLMKEKCLFQRRQAAVNGYKEKFSELLKKQKEQRELLLAAGQPLPIIEATHKKEREDLEKLHKEEMNKVDMKIILELDQSVSDQQVTLEKAGVPGFFVTNDPIKIRLQMYLLQFVGRLEHFVNPDPTR